MAVIPFWLAAYPSIISVIVVLVWRIRLWFMISNWIKYQQYKELQKKIDEKLDYDQGNNGKQS